MAESRAEATGEAPRSEGRGQPFDFWVETGKVREFARATETKDRAYAEAQPVSPPTYLMAAVFWQTAENAPWGDSPPDFRRLLHGEQEFVFHGPPPKAGHHLVGEVRIDSRYSKPGKRGGMMHFTETVTEYRDAETKEIVAEVRATLIETSKAATA
jgi:N-terminal half of MaoC dehydratase